MEVSPTRKSASLRDVRDRPFLVARRHQLFARERQSPRDDLGIEGRIVLRQQGLDISRRDARGSGEIIKHKSRIGIARIDFMKQQITSHVTCAVQVCGCDGIQHQSGGEEFGKVLCQQPCQRWIMNRAEIKNSLRVFLGVIQRGGDNPAGDQQKAPQRIAVETNSKSEKQNTQQPRTRRWKTVSLRRRPRKS
jgi:hypothetical protein